jgi:hypothetical protein
MVESNSSPIIVTGCARSGTSLVAGIIKQCGYFVGDVGKPNINNKKGFFENLAIRNTLLKPYLESIGADRMCQKPLPDMDKVLKTAEDGVFVKKFKEDFQRILYSQGYDAKTPWLFKEAKLVHLWPILNAAFPEARWVVTRRYYKDVAASCSRTGFMFKYSHLSEWAWWAREHESLINEMLDSGGRLDILPVSPQKIIDETVDVHYYGDLQPEVAGLLKWLGVEPDNDQLAGINSFISPELWPATMEPGAGASDGE